ncbi:surface protein Sur1 [Reticulomyxa filosa]|uniref:Surface protein Sur1 n=1 Tax=Reticulomyxa filosa TaxID=46433 RepID=X6P0J2_RETFI|nr:surface protein Sur1 [Reticulomyxa filosa]|eukprot:ETO31047.1 surface protein Sur1 [Reticulomyxa filosa]
MPKESRLDFGWNAQRIMEWYTRDKPAYWDHIAPRVRILHFSSSPKVWDIPASQRISNRLHRQWHSLHFDLFHNNNNNNNNNNDNDNNWLCQFVSNSFKFELILFYLCNLYMYTKSELKNNTLNAKSYFDNWSRLKWKKLMTKREIVFGKMLKDEAAERSICNDLQTRFDEQFKSRVDDDKVMNNTINHNDDDDDDDGKSWTDIPKRIHQIWLGDKAIPECYLTWQQEWKQKHQGNWEYYFWDDEHVKLLFSGELTLPLLSSCSKDNDDGKTMLNALQQMWPICDNFGEQSDLLRLFLLYQFGGVYIDMDFECILPLDVLFQSLLDGHSRRPCQLYSFMIGLSNTSLFEVNNAFMASKPFHPFIKHLWDNLDMKDPQEQGQRHLVSTIWKTGPVYVSIQLWKHWNDRWKQSTDILVLPTSVLYPFPNHMRHLLPYTDRYAYVQKSTVAIHHWGVSWIDAKVHRHNEGKPHKQISASINTDTNANTNANVKINKKEQPTEQKQDNRSNKNTNDNVLAKLFNSNNPNITNAFQKNLLDFLG